MSMGSPGLMRPLEYLFLFVLLLIGGIASDTEEGETWALLVAGSNGWDNYRHQADVLSAYHLLNFHGIPSDRIVVMVYDDIAHNPLNPFPGEIYEWPGGINVYKNVSLDYTGDALTSKNFLKVLQGEDMTGIGSGKTLKTGPNDRIFVFYSDHGYTAMVTMVNDILWASELNKALVDMHKRKKFKQLVFYLEACESGSMFANLLPKDINVYAVTASLPAQDSMACWCSEEILVDGRFAGFMPCLGDTFSYIWMQNAYRQSDLNTETLLEQFVLTQAHCRDSNVSKYGDFSFDEEHVGEFMGNKVSPYVVDKPLYLEPLLSIPSREVPLHSLTMELRAAVEEEKKAALVHKIRRLHQNREYADRVVSKIVEAVTTKTDKNVVKHVYDPKTTKNLENSGQLGCYEQVMTQFHNSCFNLIENSYLAKHSNVFANLCVLNFDEAQIKNVIKESCDLLINKPRRIN